MTTQAREGHGYSQEWLAEKVGCSVITISRWENGHTQMKGEDISKVCMVLGVSADYLLGLPVKTDLGLLEGLNKIGNQYCDAIHAGYGSCFKI